MDFGISFACTGVPADAIPEGRLSVNGHPFGGGGCVAPVTFRLNDPGAAAGLGVRVGEPMTVTFTIDEANSPNDPRRSVPIPAEGTIALAIYVPL